MQAAGVKRRTIGFIDISSVIVVNHTDYAEAFAVRRDQCLPNRIESRPKRGGKRLRDDHCVAVCFRKWESIAPQKRNAKAAEVIRRDSSQGCSMRFGLSLSWETKFCAAGGISKGVGQRSETGAGNSIDLADRSYTLP